MTTRVRSAAQARGIVASIHRATNTASPERAHSCTTLVGYLDDVMKVVAFCKSRLRRNADAVSTSEGSVLNDAADLASWLYLAIDAHCDARPATKKAAKGKSASAKVTADSILGLRIDRRRLAA